MATNIFELLGSISVDTKAFTAAMDGALAKAKSLSDQLDALDGRTVNVTVNQTTNGAGGTGAGGTGAGTYVPPVAGTGGGTATTVTSTTSGGTDKGNGNITSAGIVGGTTNGSQAGGTPLETGGANGSTVTDATKATISAAGAALGKWALDKFGQFYNQGMKFFETVESSTAMIGGLTGLNGEELTQLMDDIQRFTIDTPLGYGETVDAAKTLLGYGFTADELVPTMETLGNYAFGNSAMMYRMALALGQTRGAGKLMAQDARQYIAAGIPIFQIIADYLQAVEGDRTDKDEETGEWFSEPWTADYIMSNLNKKLRIDSDVVEAALAYGVRKGGKYHGLMQKAMETHSGRKEQLSDALDLAAAEFVAQVADYETDVVLPTLTENAMRRMGIYKEHSDVTGRYGQMAGDLRIALDDLWTELNKQAFEAEEKAPGIGAVTVGTLVSKLANLGSGALGGASFFGAGAAGKGLGFLGKVAGPIGWAVAAEQARRHFKGVAEERYDWEDIGLEGYSGADAYAIDFINDILPAMYGVGSQYGDAYFEAIRPVGELLAGIVGMDYDEMLKAWEEGNALTMSPIGRRTLEDAATGKWTLGKGLGWLFSNLPKEEKEDHVEAPTGDAGTPYVANPNSRIDGLNNDFAPVFLNDGGGLFLPNAPDMSNYVTDVMALPGLITSAVQEGFSGATVTVNVTTGNVNLDGTTLAAKLAPRVDAILGVMGARAARG